MSDTAQADEKYALITRGLEEVLGKEELKKIVSERPLRVYWGTSTTGKPHVAYFLPMMKIADFLKAGCEVTVLLADLHAALDNLKAPLELIQVRAAYYRVVIESMLRRIGAPLEKIRFVSGTEFQLSREYMIDVHKLSTLVTVHDAQRAGSEVVKQTQNPLLSGLVYPGMQAIDEEYLKVDAQFGGVDQRKIFIYAEKYLPLLGYKKRIHLMNPIIQGLKEGKMSSSEEYSKIGLDDSEAQIKKKIAKAFCEEGNTASNGVLALTKTLILPLLQDANKPLVIEIWKTKETREYRTAEALERDFQEKLVHPADLKQALVQYLVDLVSPVSKELAKHAELEQRAYPAAKR